MYNCTPAIIFSSQIPVMYLIPSFICFINCLSQHVFHIIMKYCPFNNPTYSPSGWNTSNSQPASPDILSSPTTSSDILDKTND